MYLISLIILIISLRKGQRALIRNLMTSKISFHNKIDKSRGVRNKYSLAI